MSKDISGMIIPNNTVVHKELYMKNLDSGTQRSIFILKPSTEIFLNL